MAVYIINDSLSRLLYRGLRLSKDIVCMKSSDGRTLFCKYIGSDDSIRIELIDKWNIIIVIDAKYVVTGSSSYYRIIGAAGKTLFYALKTLAGIPVHRSIGIGFTRGVEIIDYGDMIIVVLEDVVAVVGKDNHVSISNLFINYEEDIPVKEDIRDTEENLQHT